MGCAAKLSLLLLVSSWASAESGLDDRKNTICFKQSTRFKNLKKFTYQYEAETSNEIFEKPNSISGVQIACKVELEVPQYCAYSMRVSSCSLKEVESVSSDGKPIFGLSSNNEEFQQAMSRYDLKFTSYGHMAVTLYPNKNEPTNILNIKRGIISALLVPVESSENEQLVDVATVYGNCSSKITVHSRANSLATHMTIGRDLAQCNKFTPIRDHTSPIAMVTRLPLDTALLSSNQSCSYKLDGKKHVTEAICNEKHIFMPSSGGDVYGFLSRVKQILNLEAVTTINSQYFAGDESTIKKELTMEHVDDRVQSADSVLLALQKLSTISEDGQRQQRANLFQMLVAELRKLDGKTLETALPDLLKMEKPRTLTFQALLQCGTPECFGAIIQMLQSKNVPELLADAVTYSVGLMASPSEDRIRAILNMAKVRQTRGMFYALSHTVRRFYNERKQNVPEVKEVADYLLSIIGSECSGDENTVYLTLKALGNMGQAMENAAPEITTALLSCIKSSIASPSVQQAAVQALRQMTLTDQIRYELLEVYADNTSPVLKRLGAYLLIMKKPTHRQLRKIIKSVAKNENEQVKSFVSTHLQNILITKDPTLEELKSKLEDALKETTLPAPKDFRRYSRNYQIYKKINFLRTRNTLEGGLQSNVIFDPSTYVPRAVMLETTLNVFGRSVDLFEIGLEGNRLEPSLTAIFGPEGFFPDSAMKALYWVDGKVPEGVSQVLFKWFGVNRNDEHSKDNLMKELTLNFQNMLKKIEQQTPEVEAFLRVYGNELGYVKGSDFKLLKEMMSKGFQLLRSLPAQVKSTLLNGLGGNLFAHYIFLDSQFNFPTGAGLPLKLSMSGTTTPGVKAGLKFEKKKISGLYKPEIATEFMINLGINAPKFARNGIQLNCNVHFETGIEAQISMTSNQIKFNIPAPKKPVQFFSYGYKLSLIQSTKVEIPSNMENRDRSCHPWMTGQNWCTESVLMDNTPSYPLTQERRFVITIEPTDTVTGYSASLTYGSKKIEEDLEHSLKFAVEVEGSEATEVAAEIKYNTNKHSLSADVQIPKFDVEFGMKLGAEDKSVQDRTTYVVRFDVTNKDTPEVTFKGRASYEGEQKNLLLQGFFTIPQHNVRTNVETQIRRLPDGLFTEFSLGASAPLFAASYQTNFKYDSKKVQVAWNSEAMSDLQTLNEKITNMKAFDTYQQTLSEHLDTFLNKKVAQTDMTLRHIIGKSIEASKIWLQEANGKVPFAPTIQNHLQTLGNLDLEQMRSYFTLPEKLFLKNQGSIAGTFGNNKVDIPVPIPFGGKVFEGVTFFPRTVRLHPVAKEVLGITSPSNDYTIPSVFIPLVGEVTSIPSFTIPKIYKLQIPSIDKLEFSSQLNNNYYNWTSNFKCERSRKQDGRPFSVDLNIRADSVLDFLSYQLKGSALSSQAGEDLATDITGSFKHSLLTSSVKLLTKNRGLDDKSEVEFEWHALTIGAAKTSLISSYQFGFGHDSNFEIQGRAKGMVEASSFYSTWNYTMSETFKSYKEGSGSSILNFNSALLQITNRMNNEFSRDSLTFSSNTESSLLNLKNIIKVRMTNRRYEVKCDTSGQSDDGDFISNIKWINTDKGLKVENKLRGQMFNIGIETADHLSYNEGQLSLLLNSTGKYKEVGETNGLSFWKYLFHNVFAAELNDNGLQLESSAYFPYVSNQGALSIGNGGLKAEANLSFNIDPVDVRSRFKVNVQQSKATMIFEILDDYASYVNLNFNGLIDSNGVQMFTSSSGSILDTKASNNFNIGLTKAQGLVLLTTTELAHKEIVFNHTDRFTINSRAINAVMQTNGHLNSERIYHQNLQMLLQDFKLSSDYDGSFKYQQLDLTHTGQFLLEPFKIKLKGEFMGKQNAHQVKHSYDLRCAEWKVLLSANTTGKVQSNKINHKLNLEIIGFSAYFSSDASCKSKQLQLVNRVRTAALPFIFTFEVDTAASGNVDYMAKHNGKFNNKLQMKAEPFALALHHSYEGTCEHSNNNEKFLQTLLKNTLNVILNPSEQTSTWKLEGQLNNNGYMQTIHAYNNPDRIGVNIEGEAKVDFGKKLSIEGKDTVDPDEPSKIKILGSLLYDKNTNVHVVDIPFLENLPSYFNSLKNVVLDALKSLNDFLMNTKAYAQKYKNILRQINDYIKEVNLDLKINEIRDKVFKFVTDYEKSAEQLNLAFIEISNNMLTNVQNYLNYLKQYGTPELKDAIRNHTDLIMNMLIKIDEQYEITQKVLKIVIQMQTFLEQLAQQETHMAQWLQDQCTALQTKLKEVQAQLQNINLKELANRLNQRISTINFSELIEELKQVLNAFGKKVNNWIRGTYQIFQFCTEILSIDDTIKFINTKIQKIITALELDKLSQKLLDETVQFIKQYKVKEGIQGFITTLKRIDVKAYIDRAVQYINELNEQIGLYDFQKMIDKINEVLIKVITDLKEFDYNAFVDQTNNWIQETSSVVKDKISELELEEKVKSMIKYTLTIHDLINDYLTQRNLNELIDVLVDVLRSVAVAIHNDLKAVYGDRIEDIYRRISEMNIYNELQSHWQDAVRYYEIFIRHLTTAYQEAKEHIATFVSKNDLTDVVNQIYAYLEEGFIVPELNLGLITVPQFEVSIRTIRQGQIVIPSFTVPLTNLTTASYHVNLEKLKTITIPTKFEVPPITILNVFTIPSFTIDLETIKNFILTTIHDIQNFEIPTDPFSLTSDLNFPMQTLPKIMIPAIDFSAFTELDFRIPKVNLNNFMLDDIKIPEFQLPHIPHQVSVPAFGKLSGMFSISSPVYTLHTTVGIHNSTVVESKPEVLAYITARGESSFDIVSFDLEAKAQLSVLEQNLLKLSENIKLDHSAVVIDHKGMLIFSKPFVNGNAETLIKITSKPYKAEAKNVIGIKIDRGLSTKMETNYQHDFKVPALSLSSQVSLSNIVETIVSEKSVTSTVTTNTGGKFSLKNFFDEGLYRSEGKLNLDGTALTVTFVSSTDSKYVNMKQNFKTEIFPSFNANLMLNANTSIAQIGNSIINVDGTADLASLEVKLLGNQHSDLRGYAVGTVDNSFTFTVKPFEVVMKERNNVNAKVAFPFTLTGKIEFLNNYELILNPNEQRYSWEVTSRFNEYKYKHNILASNNEENIILLLALTGDANLHFLTMPITIPRSPIQEYSLWEHAGLKSFLRTPRQTFDLSLKTEYIKNKDVHDFRIDLKPVYKWFGDLRTTSENAFIQIRNSVLKQSSNDQSQVNPSANYLPKFLRIPGYTIPVLKAEVSPYKVEIPNFHFVATREITTPAFRLPIINFNMPSYTFVMPSFEFTLVNIPDSLYKLSFPMIKIPAIQEPIKLPAMGNLTYDFSLKSSLVTLGAHAELFNQSDIIARYSVSSSSIFTSNFKAEGTTSLARRRRMKLATTISVHHETFEGKHNSTLSLSWKNVDASINTRANIKLPNLIFNFTHDLSGNTRSKPNVQSKVSLDYRLLVPSFDTDLEGKALHSLTLGDLASYFNLETSANAQVGGSVSSINKFFCSLNNEASVYLSSNNIRSNAKVDLTSSAMTVSGNIFSIVMNENLALEATTRRIFAVWEHSGNNLITPMNSLLTEGSQTSKATLELAPWSVTANLNAKFSQPSSWWNRADVQQQVTVSITPESQALKWNHNGHLFSMSYSNAVELLNNRTEIRLDLAGSLKGYADFLKNIRLPVYDKNLWDVLKFDVTVREMEKQYFNASALIVCIKSEEGFLIPFPVQRIANGLKVYVPEITLHLPKWIKDVPEMILSNLLPTVGNGAILDEITFPTITIPLVNIVVPSYKFHLTELKLPGVFITPEFNIPYTTLQVPSYTINFTDITIPLRTNILPFEVVLPDFPIINFPDVSINSRYIEYNKIPYLEVTIPEFRVMISQFTLKSFGTVGQYLNLGTNTKLAADSEPPALIIPAKTIEIPSLTIHLPLAVVFPAFKSLTGNINVFTPIYNTSWIASVKSDEDKANTLMATVEATCSSTLQFLEYELEASTLLSETDDGYQVKENYVFSHPDLSMQWEENYIIENSRIITQCDISIASPTFTDLTFHWSGDSNGISSSVFTPSTGLLGMKIDKGAPGVLYGKLYFQNKPTAEIVILESQVSLENTENLQLTFKWKDIVTTDFVEGIKKSIPKMTGAVYDYANKYHNQHLGIPINAVLPKVKELLKQNVNEAYTKTVNVIRETDDSLQSAVDNIESSYQSMKVKVKKLSKRAALKITNEDYNKMITTLLDAISNLTREYQHKITESIEAAYNFLKQNRFNIPGSDKLYKAEELYKNFINETPMNIQRLFQKLEQCLIKAVNYFGEIELKISGKNTVINSTAIIHQLGVFLQKVQTKLLEALEGMKNFSFEKNLYSLKENMQSFGEKIVSNLKDTDNTNFEAVKSKIHKWYNDGMNSVYAEQLNEYSGSLKHYLLKLIEMCHNVLQEALANIPTGNRYFDVLSGWTDRLKEFNDMLVQKLREVADYVEASPKLIEENVIILKKEANFGINNSINTFNEYYKIVQSELQEDGQIVVGYFERVKGNLKAAFADARKQAGAYRRTIKSRIDRVFLNLDEFYESFIVNAQRAVDSFFEICSKFAQELFKFLDLISKEIFTGMTVKTQPGELVINVPRHLK
ncbi:apolipoprotein B-100 isoform X2 [Hemitrygon akajei]|uniref:apolipoprotein B-100 isoform X2 n=1 Tax=Hemitrygon akajei TaxID=2704970 RepID=UPI003BF9700B